MRATLPLLTWEWLIYWFAFGIVIFFGYSVYNSKLAPRKRAVEPGRPSFRPYACTSLNDGITGQRGEIGEAENGSRAGVRSESARWTGRGESKHCAGAPRELLGVDLPKIALCVCYFR